MDLSLTADIAIGIEPEPEAEFKEPAVATFDRIRQRNAGPVVRRGHLDRATN